MGETCKGAKPPNAMFNNTIYEEVVEISIKKRGGGGGGKKANFIATQPQFSDLPPLPQPR